MRRRIQRRVTAAHSRAAAASLASERFAAEALVWQMQWSACLHLMALDQHAPHSMRLIQLPVDMNVTALPVGKSVALSCFYGTLSCFYGSPHTRFEEAKGYEGAKESPFSCSCSSLTHMQHTRPLPGWCTLAREFRSPHCNRPVLTCNIHCLACNILVYRLKQRNAANNAPPFSGATTSSRDKPRVDDRDCSDKKNPAL